MSTPSLLITGATGFIGFKVLLEALEAGWTVRAAVRSASKADFLAKHPKVVALGATDSKLSFVVVPDICDEKAYEEAIKDVTHVIHVASPIPLPFLDPVTGIYEPNVKSVKAMLRAALTSPSLGKLVITSSQYGNSPFPPNPSLTIDADFRVPDLAGPPFDSGVHAYWASKVAATNATDAFVRGKNPGFDVVLVFPGWVFGRDDRALSVQDFFSGTNAVLMGLVTGRDDPEPRPSGVVHVSDAAKLHVLALNDGAPRNIGASIPHMFDEAWDIVNKRFPDEVKNGLLKKGSQPTVHVPWTSGKTEEVFSFRFRSWEDIVVDTTGQYLELVGKDSSKD
ncbi:putative cinnamoyl-CoA reductase [Xylariaceae sp. FL0594]|nr:putative cinnamoyl-CoA reductase [Xylariaceae sp. FL0594]